MGVRSLVGERDTSCQLMQDESSSRRGGAGRGVAQCDEKEVVLRRSETRRGEVGREKIWRIETR